ncbi:MAG: segregation/condensation protein A [Clostridia bacterium]|nr:segregation/condensation protein A [Clostridia bacterium]
MANEQLNFKLDMFDGPLDLLLALITKQKINIYDIPIADILDQYLEYMELCQQYNAELSSEFIVMACELLYIKSKMLLPQEEEEDPREELVRSLIEYSEVKRAANYLAGREGIYYHRYGAKPREPVVKLEVLPTSPLLLWEAFSQLRTALREEKERKKKEDVRSIFSAKVTPVESKVVFVLRRLVRAFPLGNSVSFRSMIREQGDRSDRVATFLAILELVHSGRICFERNEDDYIIRLNMEKKGA